MTRLDELRRVHGDRLAGVGDRDAQGAHRRRARLPRLHARSWHGAEFLLELLFTSPSFRRLK
jgi:hypothetical protein